MKQNKALVKCNNQTKNATYLHMLMNRSPLQQSLPFPVGLLHCLYDHHHHVLCSIYFQKQQCPQEMGNHCPIGQCIINLIPLMNTQINTHTKTHNKSSFEIITVTNLCSSHEIWKSCAFTIDFHPW